MRLDRVPDHAAVNHAVNWTKGRGLARASGFVNGVLRALVRLRGNQEEPLPLRDDRLAFEPRELPLPNGAVRTLTEDVFHLDPLPRLAAQTSHSETLVAHWLSAFGEEATRRLCLHGLVHAPIIVNLEGAPELTDAAELEPHEAPGFAVFSGAHDRLLQLLDAHPSIRVQDPTSAHPVAMTADLAPGVIADVCAGLGTKTQQLAELHAESRIVASDVDERRLASLRERFQDDDRIVVAAPDELEPFYGACDLIVMDVPCSNTGVLPRRVEARYRFSRARTEQLVSMQRQIIADAIRLRSQMGRLLYATCSLEPAENTGQASWLENWHPFRREEESTTTPQGLPGDPPTRYRDGGYAAIFGSA